MNGANLQTENTSPQAEQPIRFHIDLGTKSDSPGKVVARAISAVAELFSWEAVDKADQADVLIRTDFAECKKLLDQGRSVVHAGFTRTDGPWESLAREFPERYRFVNFIHAHEGRHFMQTFAELKLPAAGARKQAPEDLPGGLKASRLVNQKILVVDDHEHNRRSALAQFGVRNEVTALSSYEQALKLLSGEHQPNFDLLLLDLLMPAEAFTLGSTAQQQHRGSDFPAGLFVALAAARRGVPVVVIQTDASHHDHPATAAFDYIGWNKFLRIEQSSLVVARARIQSGVKDWASVAEEQLEALLGKSAV